MHASALTANWTLASRRKTVPCFSLFRSTPRNGTAAVRRRSIAALRSVCSPRRAERYKGDCRAPIRTTMSRRSSAAWMPACKGAPRDIVASALWWPKKLRRRRCENRQTRWSKFSVLGEDSAREHEKGVISGDCGLRSASGPVSLSGPNAPGFGRTLGGRTCVGLT